MVGIKRKGKLSYVRGEKTSEQHSHSHSLISHSFSHIQSIYSRKYKKVKCKSSCEFAQMHKLI